METFPPSWKQLCPCSLVAALAAMCCKRKPGLQSQAFSVGKTKSCPLAQRAVKGGFPGRAGCIGIHCRTELCWSEAISSPLAQGALLQRSCVLGTGGSVLFGDTAWVCWESTGLEQSGAEGSAGMPSPQPGGAHGSSEAFPHGVTGVFSLRPRFPCGAWSTEGKNRPRLSGGWKLGGVFWTQS